MIITEVVFRIGHLNITLVVMITIARYWLLITNFNYLLLFDRHKDVVCNSNYKQDDALLFVAHNSHTTRAWSERDSHLGVSYVVFTE
jgi:hypothetical protein